MMRAAAWAQTSYELGLVILNRVRRALVPWAHWGGRDMLLLRNGTWVDAHATAPAGQVAARYSAEKHTVLPATDVSGSIRPTRWQWVEAVQGARDMSEWFAGLRLQGGARLSDKDALMLYAHQNAWVPCEETPVRIVTRMGVEEQVRLLPAASAAELSHEEVMHRVSSINGIR